jgi:hypothetical protein
MEVETGRFKAGTTIVVSGVEGINGKNGIKYGKRIIAAMTVTNIPRAKMDDITPLKKSNTLCRGDCFGLCGIG